MQAAAAEGDPAGVAALAAVGQHQQGGAALTAVAIVVVVVVSRLRSTISSSLCVHNTTAHSTTPPIVSRGHGIGLGCRRGVRRVGAGEEHTQGRSCGGALELLQCGTYAEEI